MTDEEIGKIEKRHNSDLEILTREKCCSECWQDIPGDPIVGHSDECYILDIAALLAALKARDKRIEELEKENLRFEQEKWGLQVSSSPQGQKAKVDNYKKVNLND